MRLRVLGCGDAFGSGGRFNTCFHVSAGQTSFLLDCGASSLIAMRRFGVDPNAIRTVVLSHLHGDHFGGLPFLLLDAHLVSNRRDPLTIAGPPTLISRLHALREVMFPGSAEIELKFHLELLELDPETPVRVNEVEVTPFPVRHPSGAPSFALRCELQGKTLCYSGDTEWVEVLAEAARNADLFIAEAYTLERTVPFHTSWTVLRKHLPEIGAKQVLLTHMSNDMLGDAELDGAIRAHDGMVLDV
jgi:ribonuclease BN (tRNA processing enzyme)